MIITVTVNTAIDRSIEVPLFHIGQTQRGRFIGERPAGKGINVSSCLAHLGTASVATGFVGRQEHRLFSELLTALDIVDDLVDVAETTRRNMTYIDPVAATETHVRECGFYVDKQDLSRLAQRLHRRVQKNDTVVFAGSMPLGMKGDDLVDLIGIAQAAGAFVALDLNGPEHVQVIAAKLDLVKPNLVELEQLCGAKLSTQQEVIDQARIIQKNARCVTVTMGKRGALAVDDNDVWFARPPKNKAVQSVGAGDAFLAGFLHQRVISSDPGDCLRTAVACGAASTLQTTAGLIAIADVDRLKKQVQLQRL